MRSNLVTSAVATVLVAAALVARAEGPAAGAGKVRITVVAVKAAPAADGAAEKSVSPDLEKYAAKLKRLPFAKYESAGTTEKSVPFGEPVTVSFAGAGKFTLTAMPKDGAGVTVSIREVAPGDSQPCLSTDAVLEPGQTHITFCDGVPEAASTFVFLSSAQRE